MPDAPTFVDPTYAKSSAYSSAMADIVEKKVCPFCPDVFPGTWHTNPILKRSGNWLVTRNMFPYADTQEHLLIVGQRHLEQIGELDVEDQINILSLAQWATKELNLPGGCLAMRFGDSRFTGATVKHLHAHLLVPKQTNNKIAVVNFPIG